MPDLSVPCLIGCLIILINKRIPTKFLDSVSICSKENLGFSFLVFECLQAVYVCSRLSEPYVSSEKYVSSQKMSCSD